MNMKDILLYQKKRIIAYSMMTALGLTSLTGCGSTDFEYNTKDNGKIVTTGEMNFNKTKNLKLIHITNEIAEFDEYYLARYFDDSTFSRVGSRSKGYINIENDKIIYIYEDEDYKNFTVEVIIDHLIDYLYKYDLVKDKYNIDDIKELKEKLLNDETIIKIEEPKKKSLNK